jgi:hypothetical protein
MRLLLYSSAMLRYIVTHRSTACVSEVSQTAFADGDKYDKLYIFVLAELSRVYASKFQEWNNRLQK